MTLMLLWPAHGLAQAISFDVPRQPLADALNAVADQAHAQLLVSPDAVRAKMGEAVAGRLTVDDAFTRALGHNGLGVRRIAVNTYVIYPAAGAVARTSPAQAPAHVIVPEAAVDAPVEVDVVGRRPGLGDDAVGGVSYPEPSIAFVAEIDRGLLKSQEGGNAIDSLSLLGGLNILKTGSSFIGGVDGASRGESMYVAGRGLNAEYSLNLSDGVPMAQGMPYSRAMQMGVLPPDGLQTVSLYRSNTADMAGDAIGVTLDWHTPDPFSFPASGYGRIQLLSRVESRAADYGLNSLGGGLTFELARRLGRSKALAVYLSLYADRRTFANSEIGGIMAAQNDATWAFRSATLASGAVPAGAPEANLALTGLNFGVSSGTTRRTGIVLNLGWRPSDTLDAYVRFNGLDAQTAQGSTLDQLVPTAVSWQPAGDGAYRLRVDQVSTRVWYETNPETTVLSNAKAGVNWRDGSLQLAPYLFVNQSRFDRPDHLETSIRIDENDTVNAGNAARALGGDLIGYDSRGRPVLNLTPDMRADFQDAATRLLARRAGQLTVQTASQVRAGGGIDLRWQMSPAVRLEVGARASDGWRRAENRDWRNDYFAALLDRPGLTWADLGLSASTYAAAVPGVYDWALPRVDAGRLQDLFRQYVRAGSFDTCGGLAVNNENCNTQSGRERSTAAYVAAHILLGHWDIVPGWRQEQTGIDSVYWLLPQAGAVEQPGHWQGSHTFYNEALPSLYAVWRPADGPTLNMGVWRSYARPSFQQLAGGAKSTLTDGVLTIESGNPDLRPVTALNGEISLTWTRAPGGHMRLAGFGKALDDYLYDGGTDYINPASADIGSVRYVIPRNGGHGRVLGVEWEAQAALTSRLSATVAMTRQWTDVDTGSAALGRHQPLQNAPGFIAGAALAWRNADLSATLTYHYTSAYVSGYDALLIQSAWDDQWVKPAQRLDLGGAWQFSRTARVRMNIDNLLNAPSYWAHVGKHSLAVSDIVDSGQTFRMALDFGF